MLVVAGKARTDQGREADSAGGSGCGGDTDRAGSSILRPGKQSTAGSSSPDRCPAPIRSAAHGGPAGAVWQCRFASFVSFLGRGPSAAVLLPLLAGCSTGRAEAVSARTPRRR